MHYLIAATKPYYTHEDDWMLWLALFLFVVWMVWADRKDRRVKEMKRFDYGFWDERPEPTLRLVESNPKPYFYDWEKEDWGL